jgi:hypothetical protein
MLQCGNRRPIYFTRRLWIVPSRHASAVRAKGCKDHCCGRSWLQGISRTIWRRYSTICDEVLVGIKTAPPHCCNAL